MVFDRFFVGVWIGVFIQKISREKKSNGKN